MDKFGPEKKRYIISKFNYEHKHLETVIIEATPENTKNAELLKKLVKRVQYDNLDISSRFMHDTEVSSLIRKKALRIRESAGFTEIAIDQMQILDKLNLLTDDMDNLLEMGLLKKGEEGDE